MGGTDALLGFDYQISYALYRILLLAKENREMVKSIKFESLNEEEEDFNIYWKNGTVEFVQIKKRNEGIVWTPFDIKGLIQKYMKNYTESSKYVFITNGSANKDVNELKKSLRRKSISNKQIDKFIPKDCDKDLFKKAILSVNLETLCFVSNDESDVAKVIRKETINLLSGRGFYVKGDILKVYNALWKEIYDMSKQAREIYMIDLVNILREYGISIINDKEWMKVTINDDFKGRKKELSDITKIISQNNKLVIRGINGIGKSYIIGKIANDLYMEGKNVCWVSLKSNMTYSKIIHILGEFCENVLEVDQCKIKLSNLEMMSQIEFLLDIFEKRKAYIFIDSFDESKDQSSFFIKEIFQKLRKKSFTKIIISTTKRDGLYNKIDLKLKKVIEYNIDEFSIDDVNEIFNDNRIDINEVNNIYKYLGGFPIAISLFKRYIDEYSSDGADILELVNLTQEEKNTWIFEKIYSNLSQEEKDVLKYISTMDYGMDEYEILIVERDLNYKIKYILDNLNSKSIVLFDGKMYFLHSVIRDLAYSMIVEDTKIYIHEMFANIYEKSLFNYNTNKKIQDEYLNLKWGSQKQKLHKLNALNDKEIESILDLSAKQRFDIFGIWWCGYPYEFSKDEISLIDQRIQLLVDQNFIKKESDLYRLSDSVSLKQLYMIEYLVRKEFGAIAQGYIPINMPNLTYMKQRKTVCQWEHCIEYMALRENRNEYSCPVFGHDCPGGKYQVEDCKPNADIMVNFLINKD